jgi:hypothetical protein
MYHKDIERFSAWETSKFDKVKQVAVQQAIAFPSPFNPHRFALDPTNLCSLMPDHFFRGFSSPSWYVKQPGSYFCMHVEQLFAPFYNLCYEGGTTWWIVHDEDRLRLDEYVIARAREWYDLPADVQLSRVEQDAVRGLLYTKHVVFHPEDLIAAGIRLTEITQTAGQLVIGRGDAVHSGMASVPPDLAASRARSVNEAVNFMPIEWLTTGLPQLAEWMQWLKTAWLPMQTAGGLGGTGKGYLRAAVQHESTNRLVGLHVPAHWTYGFLRRLRDCLSGAIGRAECATRRAVEQSLCGDERLRARMVQQVEDMLAVMDSPLEKAWLLQQAGLQVSGKLAVDYVV